MSNKELLKYLRKMWNNTFRGTKSEKFIESMIAVVVESEARKNGGYGTPQIRSCEDAIASGRICRPVWCPNGHYETCHHCGRKCDC